MLCEPFLVSIVSASFSDSLSLSLSVSLSLSLSLSLCVSMCLWLTFLGGGANFTSHEAQSSVSRMCCRVYIGGFLKDRICSLITALVTTCVLTPLPLKAICTQQIQALLALPSHGA